MLTLSAVRQQLEARRERTSSHIVPKASLRLDDSGKLGAGDRTFYLAVEGREKLAREAGIPANFFAKCPPPLQSELFNTFYPKALPEHSDPGKILLVVQDEKFAVGLAPADLVFLPTSEVFELALDARPSNIDEDELEVAHLHLDGDSRVSIVSREKKTNPRPDDLVKAGIDIRHSDVGEFATQIDTFLLRLACSNGMLSRVCTHGSKTPVRVRRAAAHHEDLTRQRIAEVARQGWAELDAKMAAVEQLATESVDNPGALIRSIGEKLRLSDRLIQEIVDAPNQDELGPSGTLWDVVGAFSRVGTHHSRLSPATRRYLQELSGDMIGERLERCPKCGAVHRKSVRYLPRK